MPSIQKLLTFETLRLRMIATSTDDAEFIYHLMNTPKWLKYIGDREINSKKDAVKYIENKILPQIERLGFGNYTVIEKLSGNKIGSCGLYDRNGLEGLDIGFAFLPPFEGKGYATESSSRLIEMILTNFNISKIGGICTIDNEPSQKVLIKLGLQFEKLIRLPNSEEDLKYFSLEI